MTEVEVKSLRNGKQGDYTGVNEKAITEGKAVMNMVRARFGNMQSEIGYTALNTQTLLEIKQLLMAQNQLLSKFVDSLDTTDPLK